MPPIKVRIGSMAIDKEASRIWRGPDQRYSESAVGPIGGCPADEYDGYVSAIAAMVRDNATDKALMRYLEWAEAVHMGPGRFDPERARTTKCNSAFHVRWLS